jgi:hypothetical protein
VFLVGRLDDGNPEDGLPVDVNIELGYVVGEDVNNNIGKSEGIVELNKDGFVVGNDVDASLGSTIGDKVGTEDGTIEGDMDGTVLGFTVSSDVGIVDVMQD